MRCVMCVMCVLCVWAKKCITQQPTGVLGRKTYGRVAVDEENPCQMSLESPTRESKVKNTNVSTIGKTYLKLRGYHNTEIYSRYVCK